MTYMDPNILCFFCKMHQTPQSRPTIVLHAARERSLDVFVFGGEVQLSNERKPWVVHGI